MENWTMMESRIPIAPPDVMSEQSKAVEDGKLKNLKVKNYLF